MSIRRILGSALLILSVAATTAQADSRHRDHDDDDHRRHRHERRYDHDHDRERYRDWRRSEKRREFRCPPGLVKTKGECLRPGHARRDRYYQVGDRFNDNGYRRVPDPRMYNLQQGNGYQYYQDNNSIYQVDSKTQKVMNVMNMLQLLQMLQR